MPNYKKGQIWNKALTPKMLKFEKETGKLSIRGGKITGQFEYWLWQREKKTSKPQRMPKPKPKTALKPKTKPKIEPEIDIERFWNRLPQKRRKMFLRDLNYDNTFIDKTKKIPWHKLTFSLRKEIKQKKNARVLKEIYNLSNTEFDEVYEEDNIKWDDDFAHFESMKWDLEHGTIFPPHKKYEYEQLLIKFGK